jgi:hypothetical protein
MSDEDKAWFPKCEKVLYTPLFLNPDGHMVSWLIVDYYAAARSIVERILQRETLDGEILDDIEGRAALFLFRHYLELALKDVVFNLRRLKTKRDNLPQEEWGKWPSGHNLNVLWDEIKMQFPQKMGQKWWDSLDTQFAEKCVTEFHDIDPSSERFRYQREKTRVRDQSKHLDVSWTSLLCVIEHASEVLEMMGGDVEATYNENEQRKSC